MRERCASTSYTGYSDRCRYIGTGLAVQEEITRLIDNLVRRPIPLTLVSQICPWNTKQSGAENCKLFPNG